MNEPGGRVPLKVNSWLSIFITCSFLLAVLYACLQEFLASDRETTQSTAYGNADLLYAERLQTTMKVGCFPGNNNPELRSLSHFDMTPFHTSDKNISASDSI
ncbi:uncharacterized protein LOC108673344 [Hyalella azteca]|uniref:Uncharacterized protein LOC108673344 n=1 Tax=Hyalella azteca TaxID=294128 RepID=A0A8B7NSB2_HYAAZ|nr:uncharacterized protein LOC108673344 [Hyalella azteca]